MERSRTNNPPTRLRAGIAALGVAMSFAIGTGTVHAAGTASGTSISNLSTLNTQSAALGNQPLAHRPLATRRAPVLRRRLSLTTASTLR